MIYIVLSPDMPSLQIITFGNHAFYKTEYISFQGILINLNNVMILDLPVLETMNFGDWSFNGNDEEDRKSILLFPYNYKNQLVMRSNFMMIDCMKSI